MWRALFIGWLALALAEDVKEDAAVKSQTVRENAGGYGVVPGQYIIQTPHRTGANPQASARYQQQPQSDLYIISSNRKPVPSALTYSIESPRRLQYIQLSELQLQAQQQIAHQAQQQQQAIAHQQRLVQHPHQEQLAYETLLSQTESPHGVFYRPRTAPSTAPQQTVEPERKIQQNSSPAIDDGQIGSFERELAQLVAANRVQEQKHNAAQSAAATSKRPLAPQQYLKEVTRPIQRPVQQTQRPIQYQPQISGTASQSPPLYRYIYQQENLQQIPQIAGRQQSQYKLQSQEPQFVRPQLQQYLQAQTQIQPQLQQETRLRENDGSEVVRMYAKHQHTGSRPQDTSSRSAIYVSQSTPVRKPTYPTLSSLSAEDETKQSNRILTQQNRPLTQDEFQQILKSGGYVATLIPSDNPNLQHQEYLLHPTGVQQRPAYRTDKQKAVTYLLPQHQQQTSPLQRPVQHRPVYNIQQA